MCSEGSQQETCITLSHWPQSQVGAQPTHSFSPTGLPLAPKSDALEMPRSKPPLRCGNQPVPGSGNRLSHREPTPLTHSSSSQPGPSTCPAAPVSPWRLSVCGWGAPSRPLSLSHPPGASLSPLGRPHPAAGAARELAQTQLPQVLAHSRAHGPGRALAHSLADARRARGHAPASAPAARQPPDARAVPAARQPPGPGTCSS
jgi:hypothetical protein